MTSPSVPRETGALVYWFDISPSVISDWIDWYLRDHMPSRVGTTFTTGRCFEAIDGPTSHMVMFETGTPEALLAPDYLRLLGTVSEEDRKRRGWYAQTVRMTARVRSRVRTGMGSVLAAIRIDAFAGGSPPESGAFEALPIDAVAAIPGVGSVWLAEHDPDIRARMDQVRVTGHQDQSPHSALFVEAASGADAAQAQSIIHTHFGRTSDRPAAITSGRYRLLYVMTG